MTPAEENDLLRKAVRASLDWFATVRREDFRSPAAYQAAKDADSTNREAWNRLRQ